MATVAKCPHCGRDIGLTLEAVETLDQRLLDDLDPCPLSVRAYNAAKNHHLELVRDIAVMPDAEFLKQKNFGRKSLKELRAVIPYRADAQAWEELRQWLSWLRNRPWPEQAAAINSRVGRKIYETEWRRVTDDNHVAAS
jgi:hypothetical protein